MIEPVFWFVLIIYALFFVISVVKKDRILGLFASFLLLVLSVYIIVDGVQLKSGEIHVVENNTTTITYSYTTELGDYYNMSLLGLTLLGVSIYSMYRAVLS